MLEEKKHTVTDGLFWCHIRRSLFRWEEATSFWTTHDWNGKPYERKERTSEM